MTTDPVGRVALRNCPFCGGDASIFGAGYNGVADCYGVGISCDGCDAKATEFVVDQDDNNEADIVAQAVAAWNTRATDAEIERLRAGFQRIDDWTKAYPIEAFPEPDWVAVRQALESSGLSLDAVSGSNMRHVITRVREIAKAALAPASEANGE